LRACACRYSAKCLGQSIGQSLHHDRVVIVVILFESADELVGAEARRHRKHAEVIGHAALAAQ
jgi:hypothetical protein